MQVQSSLIIPILQYLHENYNNICFYCQIYCVTSTLDNTVAKFLERRR